MIHFLSKIVTAKRNTRPVKASASDKNNYTKNEIVKCCSIPAMSTISQLKNDSTNIANNTEMEGNVSDERLIKHNLYIQFKNLIINHSEGKKLPAAIEIETHLNISERKRKKYRDIGVKEGYIIKEQKGDKTFYFYNINY